MRTPGSDTFHLAKAIAFNGDMELRLRCHSGLICWTAQEARPTESMIDNGTFCFVQTDKLRFLLTCSHVWRGFENEMKNRPDIKLWISLIRHGELISSAIPFQIKEPKLIDEDRNLDLATITFAEIDSFDPWRFYRLSHTKRRVMRDDRVCFIGFPGDNVRAGLVDNSLYCVISKLVVSDSSATKFLLNNSQRTRRIVDRKGQDLPPLRAGGLSGAPVFSFSTDLKLWLAGVVSQVSSAGIQNGDSTSGYELSDGDLYVTHANFVQTDGSICQ